MKSCFVQPPGAVADLGGAMSRARNLYPDTALYITVRCIHRTYRLVPKDNVRRVIEYAFAVVSSRCRQDRGMEFYDFEFLSTHCLYTLANTVAAGIVHKTAHWKGFNSLRMEYGQPRVVTKPHIGIWSKKKQHENRRSSRRSGRAVYASRSTMPETAVLVLDRPRASPELSNAELRAKVRRGLVKREAEIRTKRAGKSVLGMKAAAKIHWSTVPKKGEELFGRQPTFSTEALEQRRAMKRLCRRFSGDYRLALALWNAGERDVVFPAETVRMRLRHNALTELIPLDLLLAA